jgi:hypothetical protein
MASDDRYWYRPALAQKLRRNEGRSNSYQRRAAYQDYLASDCWRRLRREALQRDGWACRVCAHTTKLDVHHRRYPQQWGAETVEDLTTLCRSCHDRYHTDQRHGGLNTPIEMTAALVAAVLVAVGFAFLPVLLTSQCDLGAWRTQPVACWHYSAAALDALISAPVPH